ncbi:GntR family transcriptional regulator [Halalkalibacterium ligniniphilum]|uniref:GntR family transcriptional regulator n=1 Tax=Halalkalibacterium ligniniphilum TaxID=1134413 RepID=UPI00034C372D|nr:GntR family transcriptional regulator [Halalkalibacterium ligniniphilum]
MKLPIRLLEESRSPIYHQIEEQIKALIVSGHLQAGSLLPSIRSLAKDASCSVITTRRAYQNLEQQGYIKTTQGKGTFVAEVGDAKKEEAKLATVQQTLGRAIETGRRHDYSYNELLNMIHKIIEEKKREEKIQ